MNCTKEKTLSLLELAALLLVVYPLGLIVGAWFWGGCLAGRLKILRKERMPDLTGLQKAILVSNHPAVIDPFLLAFLLFKYYTRSPVRHAPLIVADRIKFYDSWWFWFFRPVMVPIDRDIDENKKKKLSAEALAKHQAELKRKQAATFLKIRKAIDQGRILILFPEGGRTFKGKDGEFLYGRKGSKIRFLQEGVGLLVRKTGAIVLPVGIKGSDKVVPNSRLSLWTRFVFWEKITLNVGAPLSFDPKTSRERVTQEIAAKLLELVDEAS